MAYLQPYFKDSKAFSQLHHQGFEHLILINICSSRRLKKKKKNNKKEQRGTEQHKWQQYYVHY